MFKYLPQALKVLETEFCREALLNAVEDQLVVEDISRRRSELEMCLNELIDFSECGADLNGDFDI